MPSEAKANGWKSKRGAGVGWSDAGGSRRVSLRSRSVTLSRWASSAAPVAARQAMARTPGLKGETAVMSRAMGRAVWGGGEMDQDVRGPELSARRKEWYLILTVQTCCACNAVGEDIAKRVATMHTAKPSGAEICCVVPEGVHGLVAVCALEGVGIIKNRQAKVPAWHKAPVGSGYVSGGGGMGLEEGRGVALPEGESMNSVTDGCFTVVVRVWVRYPVFVLTVLSGPSNVQHILEICYNVDMLSSEGSRVAGIQVVCVGSARDAEQELLDHGKILTEQGGSVPSVTAEREGRGTRGRERGCPLPSGGGFDDAGGGCGI